MLLEEQSERHTHNPHATVLETCGLLDYKNALEICVLDYTVASTSEKPLVLRAKLGKEVAL